MTNGELAALIERMARSAIARHAQPRLSISGKVTERGEPGHVLVKLSPHLQIEAAHRRLRLPRKVDGVPLLISEKPSVINKPSGRWIISAMCYGVGDESTRAIGTGCLEP